MAKVTSKLQVTIPNRIAAEYDIRPGSVVEFESAGDVIRMRPEAPTSPDDVAWRLQQFDAATERQEARNAEWRGAVPDDRGWARDELYERAVPR